MYKSSRRTSVWAHLAEITIVVAGLVIIQIVNAETLSADEFSRTWQSIAIYVIGRGATLQQKD
ncbi:MAG: hypothetical protein ACREA9_00215 [Pyrinomonadaceae bacterium]